MPHTFFCKKKNLTAVQTEFLQVEYIYTIYNLQKSILLSNSSTLYKPQAINQHINYTAHSKLTLAKKCNETHRYQLMRVNLCITALSA